MDWMLRSSWNLVWILLNGVEIESHCQKSTFFLYPPSGGGGGNLSLAYPSPMGTYGLDASIIMKFGLNTTWWCGNRIPLSEIDIVSLSAFWGWGGDLVASISTMAKVDTIGKTFSNGIRICPILIDYFVVSKYQIIELSIETTHLFENRVL